MSDWHMHDTLSESKIIKTKIIPSATRRTWNTNVFCVYKTECKPQAIGVGVIRRVTRIRVASRMVAMGSFGPGSRHLSRGAEVHAGRNRPTRAAPTRARGGVGGAQVTPRLRSALPPSVRKGWAPKHLPLPHWLQSHGSIYHSSILQLGFQPIL